MHLAGLASLFYQGLHLHILGVDQILQFFDLLLKAGNEVLMVLPKQVNFRLVDVLEL